MRRRRLQLIVIPAPPPTGRIRVRGFVGGEGLFLWGVEGRDVGAGVAVGVAVVVRVVGW